MKSNLPPKCSIVLSMSVSRSSTLVASAGMTIVLHFSANRLIVPMRMDTAVFVSTISAPSSTARSATFQAMDCSLSAPKIRPFLPFNKLYAILFRLKIRANVTKIFELVPQFRPNSYFSVQKRRKTARRRGCATRLHSKGGAAEPPLRFSENQAEEYPTRPRRPDRGVAPAFPENRAAEWFACPAIRIPPERGGRIGKRENVTSTGRFFGHDGRPAQDKKARFHPSGCKTGHGSRKPPALDACCGK